MFKKKCCKCGFLGVHYRLGDLSDSYGEIQEIPAQERLDVLEWLKYQDAMLGCNRGQEYSVVGVTSPSWGVAISDFRKAIVKPNKCKLYYRYNPGYTPKQHLALQREAKTQRLLIIGTLSGALVGALAAIITQLIAR